MIKNYIDKKTKLFKNMTQIKLIVFTALFFVLFDNVTFFQNVANVYLLSSFENIAFVLSLGVILFAFTVLLFTLLSSKYTTKPFLITAVIVSSFTNYFMNTYHVVIDDSMIRNAMQTDMHESMDLFTIKQLAYLLILGILPALLIYKTKIEYGSLKSEIMLKIKTIALSILVIILILFSFNKFYTSFFREHKPLRYYTNPAYWIYSTGNYIAKTLNSGPVDLCKVGEDCKIIEDENEPKELIILVVGEAARADRFSLNGYEKETNPLLAKEDIINFSNMHSCGTSTADSVPCMFSLFGRANYSYKKGIKTENILDVLMHNDHLEILWRDNNSDSKGVALRVPYEDYKSPANNTICDEECRDEGMLVGLDKYIEAHKNKDILIVLHQMGNHGPAYYKRYPKEFEKFTPTCKTNQLEKCTQEEIGNAYDNAILYTDYFLSKVVNFLKPYSKTHETAMIYMSDHGESLGENGLYLHGMPYFMAPETQTHIGAMMWFGDEMKKDIDTAKLKSYSDKAFSHDNLFHTIIGLFEVETKIYDKDMDMLKDATIEE
jgi:lipid A ethanolaminephosphotransferase